MRRPLAGPPPRPSVPTGAPRGPSAPEPLGIMYGRARDDLAPSSGAAPCLLPGRYGPSPPARAGPGAYPPQRPADRPGAAARTPSGWIDREGAPGTGSFRAARPG